MSQFSGLQEVHELTRVVIKIVHVIAQLACRGPWWKVVKSGPSNCTYTVICEPVVRKSNYHFPDILHSKKTLQWILRRKSLLEEYARVV